MLGKMNLYLNDNKFAHNFKLNVYVYNFIIHFFSSSNLPSDPDTTRTSQYPAFITSGSLNRCCTCHI